MDAEAVSERNATVHQVWVIRYDIYRIPDYLIPSHIQRQFRGHGRPAQDMLHLYSFGKRRAQWTPYRYGGKVVVRLAIGKKHYRGEAVCSLSDLFNEFTGKKLAIKRALDNAGLPIT